MMEVLLGFQGELEEYRRVVGSLSRALIACEVRIYEIIASISCLDYGAAAAGFDELHSIQSVLVIAKYKFEFPLGYRLDGFVFHMDRNDEYSRRYWYGRFVDGVSWPVD